MSILRVGATVSVSLAAVGISSFLRDPLLNESSRKFYEDDSSNTPIPGTIVEAPKENTLNSSTKIVDGVTIRSSEAFESSFRSIREACLGLTKQVESYVHQGYEKYNEKEAKVTSTLSSLHDKNDDLFPKCLYVATAAMSGSIFARQRGILAKITFPLVLGLASFRYFLPMTYSNVMSFAWGLEKSRLPYIAKQQELAVVAVDDLVKKAEATTNDSKKYVEGSMSSAKGYIASFTGLNLDEEVSKK